MVVLAFIGSSNSLRAGVPEEHIEYEAGGIVLQGSFRYHNYQCNC